ncbi:MAG: hypothetical protein AABW81_02995 [Nanoarchaeota archaeon]
MPELERNLLGFIGRELHELAWSCDYPINPHISLWCFIQSFKDNHFDLKVNDKKREVELESLFHLKDGDIRFLKTTISYEDILSGWKNHPKYSPQSFYDSIYLVYNNLEELFLNKDSYEEVQNWFLKRSTETKEIRKTMEEYLLPYFTEHHEHMLIPLSGKIPELKEPVIFKRVIDNFPMEVFRKSILNSSLNNCSVGPCAEEIPRLDLDKDLNINKYYPSESAMTDYFFGRYLFELSKEKGYKLWHNSKDNLRDIIISRQKAFMRGSLLKWGD